MAIMKAYWLTSVVGISLVWVSISISAEPIGNQDQAKPSTSGLNKEDMARHGTTKRTADMLLGRVINRRSPEGGISGEFQKALIMQAILEVLSKEIDLEADTDVNENDNGLFPVYEGDLPQVWRPILK